MSKHFVVHDRSSSNYALREKYSICIIWQYLEWSLC